MFFSKSWVKKGLATVLAAALMAGSATVAGAAGTQPSNDETLKIATLSDTHYLSPDLIKDTADYAEHLNSDRKMFTESDAILTGLLDTIKQDDPDVLLISGDLTKDGEKEAHEDLAAKLEALKEEMPGLHIYITAGNHDLNNSNAMNFNTENGVAVPAGRTSQEDFLEIYADLTYNDETVIATFQPAEGKQGGGLSYVARPKDGFTIISIDSARYSADNTDSGLDEHETSGAISADLEQWIVEQIKAAKQRGDTVIGMEHHGMIPHFSMEPDLLPMYLVNDYERLSQVFADAGMQYIFTGHMHANDIAALTTEQGNTLYDIETGSVVTYPSPARMVTITREISNGTVTEDMDVRTITGIGPITFVSPLTGEEQTIEDVTAYGKEHGFSNNMLTTTLNGFLNDYYSQIAQAGGIRPVLLGLVGDLTGQSFVDINQLIDVALPMFLPKEEGRTLYYDSEEGGIVIQQKVSILTLNVVIPSTGLKQTLGILLDKIDHELANPENLDRVINDLVTSLTSVEVADNQTLLDYANFIYQSHLGGEDSLAQPSWVLEATGKVESGELLEQVIGIVIQNVSDLIDTICANLSMEELLGANAWSLADNASNIKEFVPLEGRTPLIRAMDASTSNALSLVLTTLGVNWPEDPSVNALVMPEGSNPEIGYSAADFLNDLKGSSIGRMIGIDETFSFASLLDELINGTPATEDEPAAEGLLTDELKGQLNYWLLGIVTSMGTDSNYPLDNNTQIAYQWNLLTDRTALDAAIAEAESIDLSLYTEETADAVKEALAAAKALPLTATQDEMDQAAQALSNAVDALKKSEESINSSDPSSPDKNPGSSETPDDVPNTGDSTPIILFAGLIFVSGAAMLLAMICKKKKSGAR